MAPNCWELCENVKIETSCVCKFVSMGVTLKMATVIFAEMSDRFLPVMRLYSTQGEDEWIEDVWTWAI